MISLSEGDRVTIVAGPLKNKTGVITDSAASVTSAYVEISEVIYEVPYEHLTRDRAVIVARPLSKSGAARRLGSSPSDRTIERV